MKRKRHTPEQIVRKLREAEADLAGGKTIPEVCKQWGISERGKRGTRKKGTQLFFLNHGM